jgi:hypothetical protein
MIFEFQRFSGSHFGSVRKRSHKSNSGKETNDAWIPDWHIGGRCWSSWLSVLSGPAGQRYD